MSIHHSKRASTLGEPNPTQRRASILQEGLTPRTTFTNLEYFEQPLHKSAESLSHDRPLILGVAGGAGSGMHQLCQIMAEELQGSEAVSSTGARTHAKVEIVRMGDFYRPLTEAEHKLAKENEYNFDHPDAIDWPLVDAVLLGLMEGDQVHVPSWDASNHVRTDDWKTIYKPNVVLFVGIFMLYKKRIREVLDMKIFVEADSDSRLSRHLLFDTERPGNPLTVDESIQRYMRFVKPSHEDFVAPSKKTADIIFPRSFENKVAIQVLCQHIKDQLVNPGHPKALHDFSKKEHLSIALSDASLRETELREWYQPLDSREARKSVNVEVPK